MKGLTVRQSEVLAAIARTEGGVTLHLQSAATKNVIRTLIAKGLVSVSLEGKAAARDGGPKHLGHAEVMAAAVDIGEGWKRATITLAEGDTLWNPYSTKKHYTGAGTWSFLIHPSSLEVERRPGTWREVYLSRA